MSVLTTHPSWWDITFGSFLLLTMLVGSIVFFSYVFPQRRFWWVLGFAIATIGGVFALLYTLQRLFGEWGVIGLFIVLFIMILALEVIRATLLLTGNRSNREHADGDAK